MIHISSKVLSEDRIEPPIHTEYLRSGGAMTLILSKTISLASEGSDPDGSAIAAAYFMVGGARACTSFCTRSAMPGYMVVPPDMTMLP